jgi:hypothetical protein
MIKKNTISNNSRWKTPSNTPSIKIEKNVKIGSSKAHADNQRVFSAD